MATEADHKQWLKDALKINPAPTPYDAIVDKIAEDQRNEMWDRLNRYKAIHEAMMKGSRHN